MQAVLPLDASCEDLEVDSSLSFLDDFVSEALAAGAPSYRPAHMRSPVTLKHTGIHMYTVISDYTCRCTCVVDLLGGTRLRSGPLLFVYTRCKSLLIMHEADDCDYMYVYIVAFVHIVEVE